MIRLAQRSLFLASAACVFCLVFSTHVTGAASTERPTEVIVIQLYSQLTSVSDSTLRIKHVAHITGGTPQLRAQIGELDLDEKPASQLPIKVTANQVRYRIRLAGFAKSKFVVAGGQVVSVQWQEATTARPQEQQLNNQLAQQLANHFLLDVSTVDVKLNPSTMHSLAQANIDWSSYELIADFGLELPVGHKNIAVKIRDSSGRVYQSQWAVTISVVRKLVMATQNIPRGHSITQGNVAIVHRQIESGGVRFASLEQSIGSVARSDIQQFDIIRSTSLSTPSAKATNRDVKRNQLLNVVVKKGRLEVVLKNARAMSDGQIGESIEVINPITGRRMLARIVNSHLVEIR